VTGRILSTSEGLNRDAFGIADWSLFWGIGLIWGSSFLLMAIGLEAFDPGLITWMRVGLGAAVLAVAPRARRPVDREDWPRIAVLSLLWVAIPFTLFPVAQQWINSAITGMLNGAMPIFAATIAAILLRRLPRGAQMTGLALGFLGVVAMSAPSVGSGRTEAIGVLLILMATVCYGFAVNIAAPVQQKYGSLPVMSRMLALATVWTAPLGIFGLSRSEFAWGPLVAISAAGVLGTGLAFVIMGSLVGRVGGTRASFITYVIPVVALVLGVVFLGDQVTVPALIGVGLVIAGAILASRRESQPLEATRSARNIS